MKKKVRADSRTDYGLAIVGSVAILLLITAFVGGGFTGAAVGVGEDDSLTSSYLYTALTYFGLAPALGGFLSIQALPTMNVVTLSTTDPTWNGYDENLTVSTDASGENFLVYEWSADFGNGLNPLTLLHLPMEGSSNDTESRDFSQVGNNATVSGPTYAAATGASPGSGTYEFNGTAGQTITTSSSPYYNISALSGEFAIEVWAKIDDVPNGGSTETPAGLASFYDGSSGFGLMIDGGMNILFIITNQTDGEVDLLASTAPVDTAWHHYMAVFDGTDMYLYIDGVLNNTKTFSGTFISGNQGLTIGELAPNEERLDGKIDEVVLWGGALPAGVAKLFSDSDIRHQQIHSDVTQEGQQWQVCVTPTNTDGDGYTICSNDLWITGDCINLSDTTTFWPVLVNTSESDFWVNDDILLCEDTYNITDENTNGILIVNASEATVDCADAWVEGNGSGVAINVIAENVTIKNCKMRDYSNSIFIDNNSATVKDSQSMWNTVNAIYIRNSNNHNISNNTFSYGSGITMDKANNSEIVNNWFYVGDQGVLLRNLTDLLIKGNTFQFLNVSIHDGNSSFSEVKNLRIENNSISSGQLNYSGVSLTNTDNLVIYDNSFRMVGDHTTGVGLEQWCDNVTIHDNVCTRAAGETFTTCIGSDASNASIYNNNATNLETGIAVRENANDVEIYNNNIKTILNTGILAAGGSSDVLIHDNLVEYALFGVLIGGKDHQIYNNKVYNSSSGGIVAVGTNIKVMENDVVNASTQCIGLSDEATNNSVYQNNLSECVAGVTLWGNATNNSVYENRIVDSENGVTLNNLTTAYNDVYDNNITLSSTGFGLWIYQNTKYNKLYDNRINNPGDPCVALSDGAHDNNFTGNILESCNQTAFTVDSSWNNTFTNHDVVGLDISIGNNTLNSIDNLFNNTRMINGSQIIVSTTGNNYFDNITFLNPNGSINFPSVTSVDGMYTLVGDWEHIAMRENKAFVKSDNLPEFNVSATIDFYGITDRVGASAVVGVDYDDQNGSADYENRYFYHSNPIYIPPNHYRTTGVLTHWSAYSIVGDAALGIEDDSDRGVTPYVFNQLKFYANYTNVTGGNPITPAMGGKCKINFSQDPVGINLSLYPEKRINMTYNASSGEYYQNASFTNNGTVFYTVLCYAQDWEAIELTDSITLGCPYCGGAYCGSDWLINGTDEVCEDETVAVGGDITIIGGGNLTLINTTFNMQQLKSDDSRISVGAVSLGDFTGSLIVKEGSVIQDAVGSYYYDIEVWNAANLLIEDSTIDDLGAGYGMLLSGDCGGKEIIRNSYFGGQAAILGVADNCNITNSTFVSLERSLLFTIGAEGNVLRENTINTSGAGLIGMYANFGGGFKGYAGANTVVENTFNSGVGIILSETDGWTITDNYFDPAFCGDGILMINSSDNIIERNQMDGCDGRALKLIDVSGGNNITDNNMTGGGQSTLFEVSNSPLTKGGTDYTHIDGGQGVYFYVDNNLEAVRFDRQITLLGIDGSQDFDVALANFTDEETAYVTIYVSDVDITNCNTMETDFAANGLAINCEAYGTDVLTTNGVNASYTYNSSNLPAGASVAAGYTSPFIDPDRGAVYIDGSSANNLFIENNLSGSERYVLQVDGATGTEFIRGEIAGSTYDVYVVNSSSLVLNDTRTGLLYYVDTASTLTGDNVTLFTANGEINYPGFDVDQFTEANTTDRIEVSSNLIRVESGNALSADFNETADLTFFGITGFTNPTIFRNGENCTAPICTNEDYQGTTYTATVASFTNYSIGEDNVTEEPGPGPSGAVPEWSDYALILILVTTVGGFFYIRRRENN